MLTREKRHQRVEDAEKRRRYRVAHGLEEEQEDKSKSGKEAAAAVDDQSPVARDVDSTGQGQGRDEYLDWEGNRKPVKKWLGIW